MVYTKPLNIDIHYGEDVEGTVKSNFYTKGIDLKKADLFLFY